MFIDTYLKVTTLLAERGGKKGKAAAADSVAFFESLAVEAKDRLERGEYPPYHMIRAACRAADVSTEKAKYLLQGFLYWRQSSFQQLKPRDEASGE